MEKTTLYLPTPLHRLLKEAARQQKKSQARLIRDALELYLQDQARVPLRSLGLGTDSELSGRDSEAWLDAEWGAR